MTSWTSLADSPSTCTSPLDPGHELSSSCCDRPRSSGDKASFSFDFEVAAARGSVVQLQTGPWESLKLTLTCVTDSASEGHDHHALDSFFHCYHSHAVFLSGSAQLLDTSSRWWSQILDHGPIRNSAAGLVGADSRAAGRRSESSAKLNRCRDVVQFLRDAR